MGWLWKCWVCACVAIALLGRGKKQEQGALCYTSRVGMLFLQHPAAGSSGQQRCVQIFLFLLQSSPLELKAISGILLQGLSKAAPSSRG